MAGAQESLKSIDMLLEMEKYMFIPLTKLGAGKKTYSSAKSRTSSKVLCSL